MLVRTHANDVFSKSEVFASRLLCRLGEDGEQEETNFYKHCSVQLWLSLNGKDAAGYHLL